MVASFGTDGDVEILLVQDLSAGNFIIEFSKKYNCLVTFCVCCFSYFNCVCVHLQYKNHPSVSAVSAVSSVSISSIAALCHFTASM